MKTEDFIKMAEKIAPVSNEIPSAAFGDFYESQRRRPERFKRVSAICTGDRDNKGCPFYK